MKRSTGARGKHGRYDHDKYRRLVWDLGVKPKIARRATGHGSGLGAQRWVVELAFAHLHWFRRLRIPFLGQDGGWGPVRRCDIL